MIRAFSSLEVSTSRAYCDRLSVESCGDEAAWLSSPLLRSQRGTAVGYQHLPRNVIRVAASEEQERRHQRLR